ncbi:Hsp70 family protein [Candidatus Deianiraea vastatrix]|uniref:Chaperone protein HscA n=1 Tax=Candidatus Deianiraea vastatrix TaxID=2163644 RepID=A0A5B8XEL7_9RICK|nr:Hsp70 family protein [Candidatus Deianiraea vastatrix]QED23762.1 Chaperone protein HscA [Candidatus Deianiraea vastatrix]
MQIEEPIRGNVQMDSEKSKVNIGIDLGTTNCVVSYILDGKAITIEDEGSDLIPSCVAFSKNGDILVGKKALLAGDDYIVIKSAKRHIADSNFEGYNVFGKVYNSTQISAFILSYLKDLAIKNISDEIGLCTITVPASYDDNQRNEVKIAAKIAGLEVKRIINEPTAAALAYGLDNGAEGIYGVYDLGGGTFDVSILRMQKGIFRVISTSGDGNLGGDDIDNLLAKELSITQKKARQIKEFLTYNEEFSENADLKVNRKKLEILSKEIIEKTIKVMVSAIESAKIDKKAINGFILVGGASRMPIIKEKIAEMLSCEIFQNLDPDKIVGIGAAISAAGRKSGSNTILLDVCPLSLGLETLGGVVEKIIYRNTPIPCSATQEFTTSHDEQTGIILNIVQGEREFAKDCRSLGVITLKNIPKMAAGMAKISVKFEIDADGILSVSAKEDGKDNAIDVEICPSYGLDYKEMSDMLISAIENAKSDMLAKLLTQTIENAKISINTIEKAINEDGNLISSDEIEKIEAEIEKLEHEFKTDDRDKITTQLEILEKTALEFMEKRTDKYLAKAVVGTKV